MWHFVDLRLADQIFLWFPDLKLPQVSRLRHAYWTFERGTSVAGIYFPAISCSNLPFQSYNTVYLLSLHSHSYCTVLQVIFFPFHPTGNPPSEYVQASSTSHPDPCSLPSCATPHVLNLAGTREGGSMHHNPDLDKSHVSCQQGVRGSTESWSPVFPGYSN